MTWTPQIQPDAPIPLHVQIRRSIRKAVSEGKLLPGQQLPKVLSLSEDLGVNRLTVLKAIQALSRAGLLNTVQGKGVFVAEHPRGLNTDESSSSAFVGPFFEGVAEGPDAHEPTAPDHLSVRATVEEGLSEGSLSFSAGFPPPEAIPVAHIRRRLNQLLRKPAAADVLGYCSTAGDPAFLDALRPMLSTRGIRLGPDEALLATGGGQNGISLCLDALLRPGQALAMESPGYMGAIAACRLRRIPMVPIPVDQRGLNPERLESALRKNEIGAIYTVCNFQNPTGVCQGIKRRQRILDLASEHDLLVIEDDIYAGLRFGGRDVAPMHSLPGGERVVYLGSFSKSLAPGLRLGFLVATGTQAEALRSHKEVNDIATGTLVQALATDLLKSGFYRRHLVRLRKLYRERRDAMVQALETHMPDGLRFSRPKGGLHLWVMADEPISIDALRAQAAKSQVAFAPGEVFFCDGRKSSAFRLNYASHPPEQIEEGMRRLADCIRQVQKEESP